MLRGALVLLVALATRAAAQQRVIVVHPNAPGEAGRVLAAALARPYVVRSEPWNTRLFRDSVFDRTVVILGTDGTVAATVHGDVVVVNGNLFLRAGARIDGVALALGGRVIGDTTAAAQGVRAYPAVRFAVGGGADTAVLAYRATAIATPSLITLGPAYGLQRPSYDRVDGLSLPWGPRVTLGDSVALIAPTLTYRSNLGALDARLAAAVRFAPGWRVMAAAGRTTASNDAWIAPDLPNSAMVLLAGRDYRNYWRTDEGALRIAREWSDSTAGGSAWLGGRTERDWSAVAGGPWSVAGQDSVNGMRRSNPLVAHGRLTSLVAGARARAPLGDVSLSGEIELARSLTRPDSGQFTQLTAHAAVGFPTFGTQHFVLRAHAVVSGGSVPPQRFAYLGGFGTLPALHVLALGGDRLLFVESDYVLPLRSLTVPLLGAPEVALVHALGSAGIGRLPRFEQSIGVRLALAMLQLDLSLDPRTRHTVFSAGLRVGTLPGTR